MPSDTDTPINYQPEPPFDIDVRPMTGETLRAWRRDCTNMTCAELTDLLNLSPSSIRQHEAGHRNLSKHRAALVREKAARPDLQLPEGVAGTDHIRALVDTLGENRYLAEALHVARSTICRWKKHDRVTDQNSTATLVRWLYERFINGPASTDLSSIEGNGAESSTDYGPDTWWAVCDVVLDRLVVSSTHENLPAAERSKKCQRTEGTCRGVIVRGTGSPPEVGLRVTEDRLEAVGVGRE